MKRVLIANVKMTWIPDHSQIEENEVVDRLAKIGKNLKVPLPNMRERMYSPC